MKKEHIQALNELSAEIHQVNVDAGWLLKNERTMQSVKIIKLKID